MANFYLPFPDAKPRFSDTGEGLENRRSVHAFVFGLRKMVEEAREEAKKNYVPHAQSTATKQELPYWMQLQVTQAKRKPKHKKPQRQKKLSRKQRATLQDFLGVLELVQANGLTYKQLNAHPQHNRVSNPRTGKYVDWWKTGTIRRADGSYGKVGKNTAEIVNELHNLLDKFLS